MTHKEFQEETDPYIGTLILYGFKVFKLVSVGEDSLDYWYELYDIEKRKCEQIGAACGITYLKGIINARYYDHLVATWNYQAESDYNEAKTS